MSRVVVRRIEDGFQAASGQRLFRRAWIPERVERTVVVVHGYGEHSGRYEDFAAWLAGRGCAVHAYDHQGHGQSSGARGHADSFDDLLDDLSVFLDLVRREQPTGPFVLIGHSMGGLVVTALASEREPAIDLLVTSGAALSLGRGTSRVRIGLAKLLRRLLPRFSMSAGLDVNGLSRDPEVVQRYVEDPLVHGTMTAAFAAGFLETVERTARRAGSIRVPTLVLHGEDDPLCECAGSIRFFAGLPQTEVAGSVLRTYPQLKHEILNEPERETVYDDILGWIRERERDGLHAAAPAGHSMEARLDV